MKYVQPSPMKRSEILAVLGDESSQPSDRIDAILSAIFYDERTSFSGDLLIEEFKNSRYPEKSDLMNLFGTFYGMHQTFYRIDDSIAALRMYAVSNHSLHEEIGMAIDELFEHKTGV